MIKSTVKLFVFLTMLGVVLSFSIISYATPTVTSITLNPSNLTYVGPNMSTDSSFQVTAVYSDGTTKDVTASTTFKSNNTKVVTVTKGVSKSGTTAGSTTITASFGGKSAVCAVTQSLQQKAITVSPAKISITAPNKTSSTLKAVLSYTNSTSTTDVSTSTTFVSSCTDIATVTNRVVKSGTKSGDATITATYNNHMAQCLVTLSTYLNSITLTPSKTTIQGPGIDGEKLVVTGNYSDGTTKDVTSSSTFKSSNTNVVSIVNGILKSGTTAGNATVTASFGGKSSTCTVTQALKVKAITITPTTATINGPNIKSSTLKVVASYTNSTSTTDVSSSATFASSDADIVKINNKVLYSGTKAGTAKVTATYQGTEAVCTVTAKSGLLGISMTPESTAISGSNVSGDKLVVTANYSDGTMKDVSASTSFKSSDTTVVNIVSRVLKSGTKIGTATITATYSGKTTTCAVTTLPVIISISINPTATTIAGSNINGSNIVITATYQDNSTADVTKNTNFTINDNDICKVVNGVIKSGSKSGTAIITAKVCGKTATCTVTVNADKVEDNKIIRKNLDTAHGGISKLNVITESNNIIGLNKEGSKVSVIAIYNDGYTIEVTNKTMFNTTNGKVAFVSKNSSGVKVVKSGNKEGKAKITAVYGGKKQQFQVIVTK